MNTNELVRSLLFGIKDFLAWIGIPHRLLDKLDEILFLICIVLVAFAVAAIVHLLLVRAAKRILRHKHLDFFESLFRYGVFRKSTALIPPLIVSAVLPFAFNRQSGWYAASEKIAWIYFFIMLTITVNAVLNTAKDTMNNDDQLKRRPIKGFIQIFQVLFSCLAAILIISILIDKSPVHLITGLGAFTAVLLLVFRDAILGLVAGVMISQNDIVRIGDWIEMPRNDINGTVIDISLNVVKVRNFDNTIVTVPPYSLVSGSLVNWRGMTESGGRRIMREYALKLDCIRPCTPEFLERMKSFDDELAQFIAEKQRQAAEGKQIDTENPAGLVNGTISTNLGLLRAYMTLYLRRHPFVNGRLLIMVRTLPATGNGLPIQIYCFSSNKNWPSYESIQSEILEHFVSVLPVFGLRVFQQPDAHDILLNGIAASGRVDPAETDSTALPTQGPSPSSTA